MAGDFFSEKYLNLRQVAEQTGFRFNYLLTLARSGKIKAFKVGDEWLMLPQWREDFKKSIREAIEKEIRATGRGKLEKNYNQWFCHVPGQRLTGLSFDFCGLLAALVLIIFSVFWLTLQPLAFAKIDDEVLTHAWQKFINSPGIAFGQNGGLVAGQAAKSDFKD